jgi:uncharacterized protein (DUF433 family)
MINLLHRIKIDPNICHGTPVFADCAILLQPFYSF